MSERHIVGAALAYARTLDTAMASGPDDLEHDALLRVGELVGGLSVHGFHRDLSAAIDREWERGDTDYNDIIWFASDWLIDAQGIMLPVVNAVANTALLETMRGWRAAA